MKFCKICKRLMPRGEEKCPFCGEDPSSKQHSSQQDKRRGFVRVPFKEKVNFQIFSLDPHGETLSLEGVSSNISLSGIYFEVEGSSLSKGLPYLKVSNIIWMEFSLPVLGKKIRLQGEIKRVFRRGVDSLGLGVMFVNVDNKSYKILNDFIDSFLQDKEEV